MSKCINLYNPQLWLTIFEENIDGFLSDLLIKQKAQKNFSYGEAALESISLGSFLYRYCSIDFYNHMALKLGNDLGLRESFVQKSKKANTTIFTELSVMDLAIERINYYLRKPTSQSTQLQEELSKLVSLKISEKANHLQAIHDHISKVIAPLTIKDIKNSFYSNHFMHCLEKHCDTFAQKNTSSETTDSGFFDPPYHLMYYIVNHVKEQALGEFSYVELSQLISSSIESLDLADLSESDKNGEHKKKIISQISELKNSFTGDTKISKRDEQKIQQQTHTLIASKLLDYCNSLFAEKSQELYDKHANVVQSLENKKMYQENTVVYQTSIITAIERKINTLAALYCEIHPETTIESQRQKLVNSLFKDNFSSIKIDLYSGKNRYLFSEDINAAKKTSFIETLLLTLKSTGVSKKSTLVTKI